MKMTKTRLVLELLVMMSLAVPTELRTRNPFNLSTIDNAATFMSDPLPTYIIESYLSTFFILEKPVYAQDLEAKMEKLLQQFKKADEEMIPKKSIWIQSLFQFETILIMSLLLL